MAFFVSYSLYMSYMLVNGNLVDAHLPVLQAQNRGFRYGDGVFETMKVTAGHIQLEAYHLERLFTSLPLLGIAVPASFSKPFVVKAVKNLCAANNCLPLARVRLAVYRQDDGAAGFVMEAMPLDFKANTLNEAGWLIDMYPTARKSCDVFANLKTANYLPYVMADLFAKEKGVDECLVLNSFNHIADASKANLFLIKDDKVFTPALHEGCVNGVMRRHCIAVIKSMGLAVHQVSVTENMLLEADEVFLTNAINGIRWVKQWRQNTYTNNVVKLIDAQARAYHS